MLLDYFFKDVGIDLGTANSLIYLKNRGLVVSEPSVAALNTKTNQILAVGDEAKKMIGRAPSHISVVRPLVGGVISDFEMTREFLKKILSRVSDSRIFSPRRAFLAIPNDLTEVERKSVEDAALSAGCAKVYLAPAPVVAALGAGLPVDAPVASLIVDIGGGTSDIAVISMDGIVVSKTLKTAGDKFNDDIVRFVRDEFKLEIGEPTAEFAKVSVGSALPVDEKLEAAIRGRDVASGLPKEIIIKNTHVRSALTKSLRSLIDSLRTVIETAPAELAGDVIKQGIRISGGGALLRGIDQLVEKETGVETRVVEDPLTATIRGLGIIVDNFDSHKNLLADPLRPLEISL